jgi:hypothetical protein
MDKPLQPYELRIKVAEQMWRTSRSPGDPIEPPLAIYAMAEAAIKEVYLNVDKMLLETIKDRLEGLV